MAYIMHPWHDITLYDSWAPLDSLGKRNYTSSFNGESRAFEFSTFHIYNKYNTPVRKQWVIFPPLALKLRSVKLPNIGRLVCILCFYYLSSSASTVCFYECLYIVWYFEDSIWLLGHTLFTKHSFQVSYYSECKNWVSVISSILNRSKFNLYLFYFFLLEVLIIKAPIVFRKF